MAKYYDCFCLNKSAFKLHKIVKNLADTKLTEEAPATGVQKGEETKSKRRIVKPTYLEDYVWAEEGNSGKREIRESPPNHACSTKIAIGILLLEYS